MSKKQIVDLVIALLLIVIGSALLVFPIFHFIEVKNIFLGVLGLYGVLNLVQFLLTLKAKDYEGLFTALACIIVFVVVCFLNVNSNKWYLALSLFIWIILMALIKLKKADYYNDRKNRVWIMKIITLIIFIICGLLTTINLYYENDIQVLVLGYFYLIHGIIELLDPVTGYLLEKK